MSEGSTRLGTDPRSERLFRDAAERAELTPVY